MAIRYLSGINVDSNTLFVDDANNRVGIGTGSPAYKLDVSSDIRIGEGLRMSPNAGSLYAVDGSLSYYSSTNGVYLNGAGTNGWLRLNASGAENYNNCIDIYGGAAGAYMIFRTNNSERMRITSGGNVLITAGNVGIGTTSPSALLNVAGSVTIGSSSVPTVNLYLTRTNGGVVADANYFVSANNTPNQTWIEGGYYTGELAGVVTSPNSGYPYIETYAGQGSATAKSFGFVNKTSGSFISTDFLYTMALLRTGQIRFNQYGSGSFTGTVAYNLAVDSSGNIIETAGGAVDGSGTANYVTKWQDANTLTNSVIYDNGTNVGIGTTSPTYKLQVNGDSYVGGNLTSTGYGFFNGEGLGASLRVGGIYGNLGLYVPSSYDMQFDLGWDGVFKFTRGNAERMRIVGNTGNVGIGTTSPNARLTVVANDSSNPNVALRLSSTGYSGVSYPYTSIRFGSAYSSYPSWNLASIDAGYTGASWGGSLLFYTNNDSGETNLTERMRITSGGSLLIGSTTQGYNPQTQGYLLGVKSDTTQAFISIAKSGQTLDSEGMIVGLDSTTGYVWMRQNVDLTFGTNNTTKVTIAAGGNVGIGTTSPGYKLDVSGDINFSNTLKFGGVNVIHNGSTDVYGNIRVLYSASTLADGMYINYNSAGGGGAHLRFFANSTNERMRIDANSGYVGINTTSPQALLHVQGSNLMTTFRNSDTGVDQYSQIEFIAGSRTAYIWLGNQNTGSWAGAGGLNIYTGAGNMDLWTSGVQRVRIDTSGNVGIGTTAPSQLLHVSGNVRVTGAYYDSSNSAGSSGQVLSSTGSGTAWVNQGEATATSLYDLLPAARVAFNWTGQVVNDTWTTVFSKSSNLLTTGTWMVRMYVSDFATGGGHYTYTYSGMFTWYQDTTNQGGESAASEIYLHRMGHAANASVLYLRTTETAAASSGDGLFQIKGNYSNTSNQTISFQFVKIF